MTTADNKYLIYAGAVSQGITRLNKAISKKYEKKAHLYKQEWICGVFEKPGHLQPKPVLLLKLIQCFQPF